MSETSPRRIGPRAVAFAVAAFVLIGFAVACPFAARLGPVVQAASLVAGLVAGWLAVRRPR